MDYRFNEGSLSLFPAEWQDASTQILRDTKGGLTIVISRAPLASGDTAAQAFRQQWEMLRPQMQVTAQSEFSTVLVGPEGRLAATAVETAFSHNNQPLWQKQLALPVTDGKQMLVLTLSAAREFTAEDHQRWQEICTSLTLQG
ncbi:MULTISPECIES: DcrB-related protein [Pantoea]|uniref:DUF1795 domain-containing protein n=1 Tax=Candidatus Pantoea multigeneris TaxID=2608357 RepID=A0ABX0RGU0_9GAMM|nr:MULTISPECIES: DcrB-related protein [Pantoea]NIF22465.1 DUF1795 domain-containing protein [Pantoea multigeneris]